MGLSDVRLKINGFLAALETRVQDGSKEGAVQVGPPPKVARTERFRFKLFCLALALVQVVSLFPEIDGASRASGAWYTFGQFNGGLLIGALMLNFVKVAEQSVALVNDPVFMVDTILLLAALLERARGETRLLVSYPGARIVLFGSFIVRLIGPKQATAWQVCSNVERLRVTLPIVLFLLLLVLYSCAVFVEEMVGKSDEWVESTDPRVYVKPFGRLDVNAKFGTVTRSFITLLQISTRSGWADEVRPVLKVYPVTICFFGMFMLATAYGLLLTIIGMSAQQALTSSVTINTVAEDEKRTVLSEHVKKVIRVIDGDRNGKIDAAELDQALKTFPWVQEILSEMGFPDWCCDGKSVVSMIDTDGDGSVSHEELFQRLATMDHQVQPWDYTLLTLRIDNIANRIMLLDRRLSDSFDLIMKIQLGMARAIDAIAFHTEVGEEANIVRKARALLKKAPPDQAPPVTRKKKLPPKGLDALPDPPPFEALRGILDEFGMLPPNRVALMPRPPKLLDLAPPAPSTKPPQLAPVCRGDADWRDGVRDDCADGHSFQLGSRARQDIELPGQPCLPSTCALELTPPSPQSPLPPPMPRMPDGPPPPLSAQAVSASSAKQFNELEEKARALEKAMSFKKSAERAEAQSRQLAMQPPRARRRQRPSVERAEARQDEFAKQRLSGDDERPPLRHPLAPRSQRDRRLRMELR